MSSTTALVWFKRDLRRRDHAALAAAQQHPRAFGLHVIEPAWLNSPECDPQHVAFALGCLADLRPALAARGLTLLVEVGDAVGTLERLWQRWRFTHLISHEETGTGWSYARDLAVARWCRGRDVVWQEHPQTGVVRRLRHRNGWAGRWAARMDAAEAPSQHARWHAPEGLDPADLPALSDLGVPAHGRDLQAAGEGAAWACLTQFVAGGGRGYRRALSSPLSAEQGCSRLSPYLAFGSLSMRCVHQATEAAIDAAQASGHPDDRALAHGLRGFAGRLRWHCHFMQKLEDEPAIEFRNFARTCDGLRPGDLLGGAEDFGDESNRRFEAWRTGRTGYPMVDACMRSLLATGWLNFRMRAMLVSFAAYHLWLHWRRPGLHLARQFLDFEPGIHWSQMQMQSGTTGINTLRIYSPAKQQRDQDPSGDFVRRWVPEIGTPDYPAPVVDEATALQHAKAVMYGLRRTPEAQREADQVQDRHGSRKAGLPSTTRPTRRASAGSAPARGRTARAQAAAADTGQRDLFDD